MSATPRARRLDPVRTAASQLHAARDAALAERDELLDRLDDLDREIVAIAQRRAQLASRLAELRDRLWPPSHRHRGRRPSPTGERELPPLPERPTWLEGRRLRSVCLALLRRVGPLTLPRLHALLHAHGYGIDSAHAAKALSDALSYEVECGRARRIRRGEYAVTAPTPRPGRHGAPDLQPAEPEESDRLLDEILLPVS